MLVLTVPDNCREERAWIASVVLDEFLGLPYELKFDDTNTIRIEAEGKTLEMPDVFLADAHHHWLSPKTVPSQSLQQWTAPQEQLDVDLSRPTIPILFGRPGFVHHRPEAAALGVDIFGSAFFMLSRYEEGAITERDRHDRFPARASLAFRENFLDRPIVDEYVEILWSAMARLWPVLQRKPREFKNCITCDVDHPYHASATSLSRLARRTAAEIVRNARKRNLYEMFSPVRNYISSRTGNWQNDPYYYTVDWMMDINEKAGNHLAFYFIPEVTDTELDDTRSINEPAVRAMMRRIAARSHEIGVHPGYHTYRSAKSISSGKEKLQRALDAEGIQQEITGGRQHYLRWGTETPACWNDAGLTYDSTLGYADFVGFRCGTSHEYRMYDLHARKAIALRQRPLLCEDCSMIVYMGYGYSDSVLDTMKALKAEARRYNGNFTLLWHNSYLHSAVARRIYCEIIQP